MVLQPRSVRGGVLGGILLLCACHTVQLRREPGEIGTRAPFTVLATAPDGRWVALCQAREDTNHDGELSVGFNEHGGSYGDALRPYFVEGTGPGVPFERWLGADPSGRYVAFERAGRLLVRDTEDRREIDLSARGAVVPPGGDAFSGVATVRFASGGRQALFFRSVDGAIRPVLLELPSGKERVLPGGEGLLGEAEFGAQDHWVREGVVPADTDGDGRITWPRIETDLSESACRGPAAGAFVIRGRGDAIVERWRSLQRDSLVEQDVVGTAGDQVLVMKGGALVGIDPEGGEHLRAPASCGPRFAISDDAYDALVVSCTANDDRLTLIQGSRVVDTHLRIPNSPVWTVVSDHPRLLLVEEKTLLFVGSHRAPSAPTPSVLIDMKKLRAEVVPPLELYFEGQRYVLAINGAGAQMIDLDTHEGENVSSGHFRVRGVSLPWVVADSDLFNLDTGEVWGLDGPMFQADQVVAVDSSGRMLVSSSPRQGWAALMGPLVWAAFR